MNFNPYIYILYYQSNLLNYLSPSPASYPYMMKFITEVLEQPRSETRVHNIVTIREWRHAKVDGQKSYWLTLTLLRPEAWSRSHNISMFCIEKCKKLEMLVSFKATALRM